ncbi:hypothetical protein LTR08_001688 [Meristemomyces frigidus]|nr:hypothetical protein LTR08_001688 [Meristemomyces frigidus]
MSALSYVDIDKRERSLALLPSTYPVTYLGDLDEGNFECRREMFNEEMMPLKL